MEALEFLLDVIFTICDNCSQPIYLQKTFLFAACWNSRLQRSGVSAGLPYVAGNLLEVL